MHQLQEQADDQGIEETTTFVQLGPYLLTVLILLGLMLAAGIATHFVPAGRIVNGVWRPVDAPPLPWWQILSAPLLCLTGENGPKVAALIVLILLIGGSFSIMNTSKALPGLMTRFAVRFQHRKSVFLIGSTVSFALIGSVLGLLEELTPMILFFVPMALRMGWDRLTGMAIPFAAACCGFASATLNPFTLGVAQTQAELPLFSGLTLRFFLFAATTGWIILFLLRHTRRLEQTTEGHNNETVVDRPVDTAHAMPRPRAVVKSLVVCFSLLALVVIVTAIFPPIQDAAFPLIALVFVIMGFVVGRLQDCRWRTCGRYFRQGVVAFSPALILILLASSIPYLIQSGKIMDTILFSLAEWIERADLQPGGVAILMYLFQMALNLLIPGGSSQAMLTIPILAPLGYLVGVSRQTVVLAFHCGDGFSNMLWPTNPLLIIALGLANVRYRDWFCFILPLQLGLLVICSAFLLFAVWIGYA